MGHLKSMDLPEQGPRGNAAASPSKSRWLLWVIVIGILAAGVWYYRSTHSGAQAVDAAAPGTPGAAGKGRSGAGGLPPVSVVVATAQKGDLPVYFNGLGTVTAFNTVTVHSRVDGQIMKVNFTEGQFVHEGDALVEIDPRPYQVQLEQAQGQMAKDQAQLLDVKVDLDRYQTLFKEGVIPKQQVDTQQAQVGQYEGAIKADQATIDTAKLQLIYSHVTAPISGRVGLRLVDVGNVVHATDAAGIVVITQLQPISVIFTLPQDQLPQVMAKLHSPNQLTVDAFDRDDTAKITTGKLATIDNQIDTTTGTYKLKAIFSNENNILFPNQFVNVHLLVDNIKNTVIVPTTAIQRGPQGTYVYAVGDSNIVKIHPVTLSQTTGNNVSLSSGVNPGDVVVIDGQDKLQDGSKVIPNTSSNVTGKTPGAQAAAPNSPAAPGKPASGKAR
jgi:membrane fusion protein, multidrug efflux system